MYPFLCTLPARYALSNKYSNSQKDLFRSHPLAPSLVRLETMPTVRGKKLIVSAVWGHVRHPNCPGDIIFHWYTACLSLAKDVLPYYDAIFVTLLL